MTAPTKSTERPMAEISEAIWELQDELDSFHHPKHERDMLHAQLHALYRERCERIGHEPDRDAEQCLACGEWIS